MKMQPRTEAEAIPDQTYALTHKIIGDIRGRFFVPSYQRGYRWVENDVTRLLDDIWESKGKDYSLQPIVVKLRSPGEEEAEREWELIDGQQRLTTLYLILHYIQKQGWKKLGPPYSLHYETRLGNEDYIETLDKEKHETNIDFFHLYQAHQYIGIWFQKHGDEHTQEGVASEFDIFLRKSVRVIWYAAPSNTDATALFTRLNVGRIPLTDAELIKAALLSKARASSQSLDKSHEIAAQWDNIERDLHDGDIWAFVAGHKDNESAEKYPTRISLLLDTLADEKVVQDINVRKRPRYFTFDTLRGEIERDYLGFWKNVVALHAQILGWFKKPTFYNKIGFLVTSDVALRELAHEAKIKKKSEYEKFLDDKIRQKVGVKEADLDDLSYDDKKSGYPKLFKILLLMNVETSTNAGLRFPFSAHNGQNWSLEHIHAQNAEELNKAEQWKTWLESHNKALDAIASDQNAEQHKGEIECLKRKIDAAIENINNGKKFSGKDFNSLSDKILEELKPDKNSEADKNIDHSIRNMALLSRSDNSSLNNSVFEVKRQMILKLDRNGSYVPICTRNVFLKYYAEADAQQPHFWSEADKDSYIKEIRGRLKPYFTGTQHEGNI
jgi:Protein of unknown function DUF262/Protein of unknown function (DUF1524)